MKLKIGKIPYANLFPIFYVLEKECDCAVYEFVEGVPSELNRMLRDGEIDVSPSSSIEYLKNPSLYQIIEGHSISSRGPIGSIFLFSKKNIHGLNNSTVHVSSQSETSVALLDIILKKFYGIQCKMQVSRNPENSGAEAFLLIGDDAIKCKAIGNRQEAIGKNINKHTIYSPSPIAHRLLVYDLGEIWYEKTGLPFVFALWIARKKLFEGEGSRVKGQKELLNKFIKDLDTAKKIALKNLSEIAQHSPMKEFMSEEEIISYWNKIDYELTPEHKRGLDLFNRYLKELSCF
jgi:chorismate dehydratase